MLGSIVEFVRMEDSLAKMWNKLSLTDTEQEEVTLEQDWVEETEAEGEKCIIGKVLSNRVVNMEAMRNVFSKIWKLSGALSIKEVGEKVYLFRFEKWVEKERVLYQQ